MTITFFSNFLNHHQTPFCNEMYKRLGSDFTFVSTERIPQVYIQNGYYDCSDYVYNLNSYIDKDHNKQALQLGITSDIVILGAAPDYFIKERIIKNKITFKYSERELKRGKWKLINPRFLLSALKRHTLIRNKSVYMLCAGAYVANDLNLFLAYPAKKYKWGYFTEVEDAGIEKIIDQKPHERIEIIWVSRFIDWKHPELAIKLAYELKCKGYDFHLNMIGSGKMFSLIQELITKLNVNDCVSLLGSMPNKEVRNHFKIANIFIFTSDRNEGWGAVLNEAMSYGCSVIVSNLIGATPYLVANNNNGLVFKSGSLLSLLKQTEILMNDKILRQKLGLNAHKTISEKWSPQQAAENFLHISDSLLKGQIKFFMEGPCSKADKTDINFYKHSVNYE